MEINIQVNERYPIGNTGDGVSTNSKAACVLWDLHGLHTPEYRCSAHVASGTIKRLATSKTMNVPEVTALYECLRAMIKHFKSSVKNIELLDDAMEILEASKLHLISWCQTRMAHFLNASKVFDDMLPAIYDVMFTKNVRKEERDILFTPQNIFILKIISQHQPIFESRFLRKADKGNLLVTTVFNIADSFATEMSAFETHEADEFKESMKFDTNGNLLTTTKIGGNARTMLLNFPHNHIMKHNKTDSPNSKIILSH